MLHFTAVINWNTWERNIKPAIEVNFSIPDREKIGLKLNITLNNWVESAFSSYENKKKFFSRILLTYKLYLFVFLKIFQGKAFFKENLSVASGLSNKKENLMYYLQNQSSQK